MLPSYPKGTNLIGYSENVGGWVWNGSGTGGRAPDFYDAPNGIHNADDINTNGALWYYRRNSGLSSNTVYTFGMWCKTDTGTKSFKISRTNAATWTTATLSPVYTATTTWQLFTLTYTTGAAETVSDIHILGEGKTPFNCTAGHYGVWGFSHNKGTHVDTYHPVVGDATTSWSARYRKPMRGALP